MPQRRPSRLIIAVLWALLICGLAVMAWQVVRQAGAVF